MTISAKTRSRQVLIGEPDADGGLNDNTMHPGHELSDLRNVQRQPAGEAVVHYARFAQISSFPDHPETEPAASVPAPPMDAAVEKQEDEKKPVRRRVALTCICSLIFHATLAAVLIVAFPKAPEEAVEEAGQAMSVVMYGDFDVDQTAAGETETTVQQEIIPEPVQPETIQPTETADVQPTEVAPVETQDPIQQAPAPEVTRVSPETAAAVEPEILVSEVLAEESVAQPMSTVVPEQQQVPVDTVSPEIQPTAVQPTEVQPATQPEVAETPQEVKPVETAEVQPEPEQPEEIVTPTPKPKVITQEKPKPVEKKRPPQKAAGRNGEQQQNSERGIAEGDPSAQSDRNSQAASNNNGVGTAARANYGGKVRARIRRALREPKNVSGTAGVRLTITGSGNLVSAVIFRSSGVPEIDQAAADAVRRASPFSPPPGGISMSFTQVFEIGRK
ncbi:TonB family protein [Rhizobium ruizarguesonis]|nr:energy transducer TonB [Rhizobium ruizarguesonis]QIJ41789.1 TonB family protein [Rhizobium leguminosarum]NEH31227.1 TonB family protein [Rhizobium ruizarguesonis]NEJ07910.1 TonB family protein [Rhizobium ruizarguesonis]TAU11290.1 TonB family protein [Rhizobium ruizarguesonis]TAW78915.1 TonB family protein [Rhizobium ruizarguesonis]